MFVANDYKSSNHNLLRWLLRRGSPLPISNREVKPACADGTAILWESMSSPFFLKNPVRNNRVFCFIGTPFRRAWFVDFLLKSLSFFDSFFCLQCLEECFLFLHLYLVWWIIVKILLNEVWTQKIKTTSPMIIKLIFILFLFHKYCSIKCTKLSKLILVLLNSVCCNTSKSY